MALLLKSLSATLRSGFSNGGLYYIQVSLQKTVSWCYTFFVGTQRCVAPLAANLFSTEAPAAPKAETRRMYIILLDSFINNNS